MSQGKPQEALKEMDIVIKLNPRHTQGHYQRGMLLARLGQSAAAEKELQTFRQLEKEDREQRKIIESKILTPAKP
jgi:regulator of sirC expression with transglutaminase-like and TPR domain